MHTVPASSVVTAITGVSVHPALLQAATETLYVLYGSSPLTLYIEMATCNVLNKFESIITV